MQRKYTQLCIAFWRTRINKVIKLKTVSFVALYSLYAPKSYNFVVIHLLQAKNVKWCYLIWVTL